MLLGIVSQRWLGYFGWNVGGGLFLMYFHKVTAHIVRARERPAANWTLGFPCVRVLVKS